MVAFNSLVLLASRHLVIYLYRMGGAFCAATAFFWIGTSRWPTFIAKLGSACANSVDWENTMKQLLLYCRAGFEKECAAEIQDKAGQYGVFGYCKLKNDAAFIIFEAYDEPMLERFYSPVGRYPR